MSADTLDAYLLILMLTAVVPVGRCLLLAVVLVLGQEKFLSQGGYAHKIILGGVLLATPVRFPKGLVGFVASVAGRAVVVGLGKAAVVDGRGAAIAEINRVRKHLSALEGGRRAVQCAPAWSAAHSRRPCPVRRDRG